jgi:predicted nucleotidyltransferase component of viral defense system
LKEFEPVDVRIAQNISNLITTQVNELASKRDEVTKYLRYIQDSLSTFTKSPVPSLQKAWEQLKSVLQSFDRELNAFLNFFDTQGIGEQNA